MKKQEYKKALSNGTTATGCGYKYTFFLSGDRFVALPDGYLSIYTPTGGKFAAYLEKDETGNIRATEETTGRLINPFGFYATTYKRAAEIIAERIAPAVLQILESGNLPRIAEK